MASNGTVSVLRAGANSGTLRRSAAPSAPQTLPLAAALGRVLSRTGAIIAFFTLWEVVPRLGLVEEAFLPPISAVLKTGWELLNNGQLAEHTTASLQRSLSGFGLAILYAVPLGLAIGWFKKLADVLSPLLEMFRNTAPLSLLPVFLLLLGIGELSKIALVTYSCTWPILLNTISGVRNVDPLLIKSAKTMGLSSFDLLRKVMLPAALPTIFVGIRLAGGYSLLVLVASEMVGAKAGLGYLIIYSQYNFQIPHMFVGILTLTALGLSFARLLLLVEQHFTAWKAPAGSGE
jgi:NitT/TauT family transport system permease protein